MQMPLKYIISMLLFSAVLAACGGGALSVVDGDTFRRAARRSRRSRRRETGTGPAARPETGSREEDGGERDGQRG